MLYKIFCHTKVVRNQNSQLLGYVTFFDILHHYGVIAASQICSVSRKCCAVLRNRFFSFAYIDLKHLTQLSFCSAHNFADLGMQFPHEDMWKLYVYFIIIIIIIIIVIIIIIIIIVSLL